ncbi:hypothetical protein AX17_007147 [Amanita inopinata Kibby_2008]|nr:hypothetical protein AX17_007147 [Amanita inopinata Kibby_2008]
MRQLSLHTSALNDAEYDLYTSSLNDIADENITPTTDSAAHAAAATHDDAHYERMSVGIREARAWLRGRYSHVPAHSIDAILKFFSPSLGQTDVLSGGQFFAALRLVVHVENGKQVDRSLAFVQAHPDSPKNSTKSSDARPGLHPPPPPPPSRRQHEGASKTVSLSLPPTVTQIPPAPSTSTSTTNPFTALTNSDPVAPGTGQAQNSSYPQPPQHPMLRVDPTKSSTHSSHNPFATKSTANAKPEDSAPSSRFPPLPPRKPPPPVPATSLPPATRHAAPIPPKRSTSPVRTSLTHPYGLTVVAGHIPPPPPSKPVSHVTSTLMKQSLQASKVAQSLKKAEEQLEKERILQVLKSSSGPGTGGVAIRNRSSSPAKGAVYAGPGGTSAGMNNTTTTTSATNSSSSYSGSDERDRERAPPLPKRRGHPPTNVPAQSRLHAQEQGQTLGHGRRLRPPSPGFSTISYEQVALAGVPPGRTSTSTTVNTVPTLSSSTVGQDTTGSLPAFTERGRAYSHPPRSAEGRTQSHSRPAHPSQYDTTRTIAGTHTMTTSSSVASTSTTGSPSIMTGGLPLPPVAPPTHPDLREDRDRRYSSGSVLSGKSGKSSMSAHSSPSTTRRGTLSSILPVRAQSPQPSPVPQMPQMQMQGQVDTRPFDSVYGSLVSPLSTGNASSAAPTTDHSPPSQKPPLPSSEPLVASHLSSISLTSIPLSISSPATSLCELPEVGQGQGLKSDSPTARVFRSKSMHQPGSPVPPVPPPLRRKRPESVQVLGSNPNSPNSPTSSSGLNIAGGGATLFQELVNRFGGSAANSAGGEGAKTIKSGVTLSRHLSLSTTYSSTAGGRRTGGGTSPGFGTFAGDSHGNGTPSIGNGGGGGNGTVNVRPPERRPSLSHSVTSASSAPVHSSVSTYHSQRHHTHHGSTSSGFDTPAQLGSNIQRTLASFQPALDKARYKAEAGLSRRGFVRDNVVGENGEGEVEKEGLVRKWGWNGWSERNGYGYDRPGVDGDLDHAGCDDGEGDVDDEVEGERGLLRNRRGEGMNGNGNGNGYKNGEAKRQEAMNTGDSDWDTQVIDERDHLKWPVEVGEGWKPL